MLSPSKEASTTSSVPAPISEKVQGAAPGLRKRGVGPGSLEAGTASPLLEIVMWYQVPDTKLAAFAGGDKAKAIRRSKQLFCMH